MTEHPTAAQPAAPDPDAAVPAAAPAPAAPATPAAPAGTAAKVADLADRYRRAVTEPEAAAADRQHARGRRTARERIESLLDPGSFTEIDAFVRHRSVNFGLERKRVPGDGVVVGHGTVDGRPVAVYSQDFTVFGGSLGEVHGQKITKVMDLALRTGVPLIGISDGGGA
ncbi:MAG TPA: carboxyl transferase domain-containing protein, partial [Cellulomonas sp.]